MATKAIAPRRRRSVVYIRRARARVQKTTIPLAMVAGFAPLGMQMFRAGKLALAGRTEDAAHIATIYGAGYDIKNRRIAWNHLMYSYAPVVIGGLMHKVANKMGVNRALAGAGVPFIRI